MIKVITIWLIFLFSALSSVAMAAVPVNGSSNILVIIADDLGVDNVNAYNEHNNSPNTSTIDSLANNGVLFRNAWSNTICAPSRAAIYTGRHGFRNGVTHVLGDNTDLPSSEETVAEVLSSAGYATAMFGKWGLGSDPSQNELPTDQGFDYYSGAVGSGIASYTSWPKKTIDGNTTLFDGQETEYATKVTATEAAAWIDTQGNNPWFTVVAFNAPHTPFHVPPDDGANKTYDDTTWTMGNTSTCTPALVPGSTLRHNEMCYRAAVEAMDYYIQYLLNEIDQTSGVLDNTIIIFIGDNGTPNQVIINETDATPFNNTHGKGTQYEGGINVPFIISGGNSININTGEVSDMVLGADLFSTIINVANASRTGTGTLDSVSLVGYLDETTDPVARSANYSELYQEENSVVSVNDWTVSNNAIKYIQYLDGGGIVQEECYELTVDPGETNNVWGDNSSVDQVCEQLKANNPTGTDTDGDGLLDAFEILIGTDINNIDTDGDSLTDGFEVGYDGDTATFDSTTDLDPLAEDTDSDGYNDDVEINENSDPLNSDSLPIFSIPVFGYWGAYTLFILIMMLGFGIFRTRHTS